VRIVAAAPVPVDDPPAHTGYIFDASVIVKWFTRQAEPDRARAAALRSAYLGERFRVSVPELCLVEVANALRWSPRAKAADVVDAIKAMALLGFEIVPTSTEVLKKANAIAWAPRRDSLRRLYVALAELRAYPLITADDVLVRKTRGHGMVLALRSLDFEPLLRR
jgi:predicted nucleic acid-binding protein